MTKKAWFLPLVCVLLISGGLAPAASASAQTTLSLNDRLASSPSGTGSLLS
ncbi:MAG: ribonuclease, partial [Bacillota bacterium]|nr:ribonuclease [Bacillota bacterium]